MSDKPRFASCPRGCQAAEQPGQRGVNGGRPSIASPSSAGRRGRAAAGRGRLQPGSRPAWAEHDRVSGRAGPCWPPGRACADGRSGRQQSVERRRRYSGRTRRSARCPRPPRCPAQAQARWSPDPGLALDQDDLRGLPVAGAGGGVVESSRSPPRPTRPAGMALGPAAAFLPGSRWPGPRALRADRAEGRRSPARDRCPDQRRAAPCARVRRQRGCDLAARDVTAEQQPQGGLRVRVTLQRRGRGIDGARPVAGVSRTSPRRAWPGDQAVQLGQSQLRPVPCYRRGGRVGPADERQRDPRGCRASACCRPGLAASFQLGDQGGQLAASSQS